MKLVAVSVIKNEADIVEPFIRHTRAWADLHLVFDHASTDGTRDLLARLVAEGLPLRLFTDDALGNLQQFRSNHLAWVAVEEFDADWVVPLDADEFLVAPSRAALEQQLGDPAATTPASLPMANYYPVRGESAAANPAQRLTHRASLTGATRKIILPAALVRDRAAEPGKGNHAVYRDGAALPDRPLPEGFHLAHFALRSLGQQVMRVVTAELQKLQRGRAHAGLDVHYRLGFQLLADNPDSFLDTFYSDAATLTHDPVPYLGGELRYTGAQEEWKRVACALLPFLESLARSHGELVDQLPSAGSATAAAPAIRPLKLPHGLTRTATAFAGFTVVEGLQPLEGPFAGAFLPRFRWGTAPRTVLAVTSESARSALLRLECLSYLDGQSFAVLLNGEELPRFTFPRIYQKETVERELSLRAGENRIEFAYHRDLQTPADPRRLAVIFLAIQVC